jgi:hypothetical protein
MPSTTPSVLGRIQPPRIPRRPVRLPLPPSKGESSELNDGRSYVDDDPMPGRGEDVPPRLRDARSPSSSADVRGELGEESGG